MEYAKKLEFTPIEIDRLGELKYRLLKANSDAEKGDLLRDERYFEVVIALIESL